MEINYINGWNYKSEKTFKFSLTVGNMGNPWQNIILLPLANKCIYDGSNCIPQFFFQNCNNFSKLRHFKKPHILIMPCDCILYTVLKFSYPLWEIMIGGSSSSLLYTSLCILYLKNATSALRIFPDHFLSLYAGKIVALQIQKKI